MLLNSHWTVWVAVQAALIEPKTNAGTASLGILSHIASVTLASTKERVIARLRINRLRVI